MIVCVIVRVIVVVIMRVAFEIDLTSHDEDAILVITKAFNILCGTSTKFLDIFTIHFQKQLQDMIKL